MEYNVCLSFDERIKFVINETIRTDTIPETKLAEVNFNPIKRVSKIRSGILRFDEAPMKTSTLESLLPFFKSIHATGSTAYKGKAVSIPNIKETIIPFTPDPLPMILIIVFFSIHTSISPVQRNTGKIAIRKVLRLSNEKISTVNILSGKNIRTNMIKRINAR